MSGASVSCQAYSRNFSSLLVYAILEWFLILLLFLNAVLSYVVTEFADFFGLQTPCLLCSRIDHKIGSHEPGFYRKLICHFHGLEISSLAYCHVHEKLANVQKICGNCLPPSQIGKGSISSKLGIGRDTGDRRNMLKLAATNDDVDYDGFSMDVHVDDLDHDPLIENSADDSNEMRNCSCCGVTLRRISDSLDDGHGTQQENLNKKKREGYESSQIAGYATKFGSDSSHFRYERLNITSDSESEVPFSDKDDISASAVMSNIITSRPKSGNPRPILQSLSRQNSVPLSEAPLLVSDKPLGFRRTSLPYDENNGSDDNLSMERTSMEETKEAVLVGLDSEEHDRGNVSKEAKQKMGAKYIDKAECFHHDTNGESSGSKGGTIKAKEALIRTDSNLISRRGIGEPGPSGSTTLDLNEAYILAIGSKGSPPIGKDPSRIQDDLKLLLSPLPSFRGLEFLPADSPRTQKTNEAFRLAGASSPIDLHKLYKKISMDRKESGMESLDGSVLSEIEGESGVDRLKRQVEFDRKSMRALYRELEEERSASAISVNQAMAMITRLQEEKAMMQMESQQYQRMMEEQAEYDQEALQKLNDLLDKREKEMKDLEEEVKMYRKEQKDGEVRESKGNKMGILEETFVDPEDERLHILECLENLEKRLYSYTSVVDTSTPENNVKRENDLGTIESEVKTLRARLEAIEEDREFLLHIVNSLRKGNTGINLIQEVGQHLRGLRGMQK
ncbi:hypothetical protein AMTRI_Chr03g147510 [Amborella trichopoda]|uniref:GTD-binding domain-containing protein n=1 Tax=Amborella trichopoda TaxID=13333 RepID=W1P0C1_AMBTC|nr:probable myosin-binding protein 5 [Amborella trichopoda]XP_020520216.1 probable myosin-binding protein 5 [Amborella trichopoda]ERN01383.1 hypothetical protein AMTR_s00002p00262300 [Amborella trichopoda]|eukprot:XP_020520215.1 probable myosin-binding protein 5 [Amborella trichopoda]